MDSRDTQRELEALETISGIGALIEAAKEQECQRKVALARSWEQQYTLEAHIVLVASTLIDTLQMKAIDRKHPLTLETERAGRIASEALIARLGGNRTHFEELVQTAVDQENERRKNELANTQRAAHKVYPKTWTITSSGKSYKLVPQFFDDGSFWGRYHVMLEGEKVGYMDYSSESGYWKVPNHTHKKDLKKAFADFLDWQKNPRHRK